ncbi:glycosyltransferase [Promicromonospora sukumoe]|uniref:glycosyltransferase family protein n=1 Tax=Promicromonospora sukumoe TaxID=88382 RepID=UPI0037CCA222
MALDPSKIIRALVDGRGRQARGGQDEPTAVPGPAAEPAPSSAGHAEPAGPAEPAEPAEPEPGPAEPEVSDTERVLGSGVFDVEWYEAQAGTTFPDPARAVEHYLARGRRAGWSPHPLFVPARFRTHRWEREETDPLITYLDGVEDAWRSVTSPLFDPAGLDEPSDAGRSPLVAFLEENGPDVALPLAPESGWLRAGLTLTDVREALRAELREAGEPATTSWQDQPPADTVPGLVTVVVVDCCSTSDVTSTLRAIDGAALPEDAPQGQPVDAVLLVPGERRRAVVGLTLARLARCAVRVLPVPADRGTSSVVDEAAHGARGEHVLLMSSRQGFREGALADWPAALAESDAAVVHPLVLGGTLLVRDAGVVYPPHGKDPVPFLKGVHPDSVPWPRPWFAVPGAPVPLLARTESVRAVRGPSRPRALWADVDLSQRLAAHEERPVVVVRDLVATRSAGGAFDDTTEPEQDLSAFRATWREVPPGSADLFGTFGLAPVFQGLTALSAPDKAKSWTRALWLSAPEPSAPEPSAPEAPGRAEVREAPPALRWAIKTAMPAADRARQWGDFHFAHSLADALRGLGQRVVVDYGPNDARETSYRDDVVLMLRGLRPARVPAHVTSAVWVISHPEDVTARELATYDLRYAASLTWPRDVSARWDLPVRPLLQCTDPSRFYVDDETVDEVVGKAVLVGNSRNQARPVAVQSVRSGTPVAVYGAHWEKFLPPEVIAGTYVPNEIVRRYYRSAAWALNDHWPDMRDLGFVANRVFDILASGGRLLTDDVHGLAELFRPVLPERGLATFTTPEELHALLAEGSDAWYDEAALRTLSEHVRTEHSFAARAAVLLEDVLAQRAGTVAGT